MSKIEIKENLEKYRNISGCPIRNVVARFSGKWSILVLCVLSENDSTRFNALSKSIPDISPKVLTDTLRNLERDRLIKRTVFTEIPPRVEYSLTPMGRSLIPHLMGLIGWAIENYDEIISEHEKDSP